MYTYVLVAVVLLFAFYKYDLKETMDVQVTDKDKITLDKLKKLSEKGGKSKDSKVIGDWSKYVLKSSIPPCPTEGSDALQFSGDPQFKGIEDCYSKNKPQGGALKIKDFVKCVYPAFTDSKPATVPTVQTKKKEEKKDDSFDFKELWEDIKDFVKDNLIYLVIGVSIIIAALIVAGNRTSSPTVESTY